MQNYFLQIAQDSGIQAMIDKITPEIPHSSFITDLAIIMILASVVTLAFFKMRQPLIIGYLFVGMLIGPLSPIWSSILPEGNNIVESGGVGILSDTGILNIFA